MSEDLRRGILSCVERLGLAWEGVCLVSIDLWRATTPLRLACHAQSRRTARAPLGWSFLYVAAFCLVSFWLLDRPVARLFKDVIQGDIQGFFKIITHLGEAEWYLIPAGTMALGFFLYSCRRTLPLTMAHRLRRWAVPPAFLFLSIALSGLIGNAVKYGLGRMRPRYFFDEGLYGLVPFSSKWAMNSFPSGHSQAAFAAMTALAFIWPRHVALWFTIAALVALSRVTTTVHWLSDAVGGAWLGICVTVLLARLFRSRQWLVRIEPGRPS